MAYKYYQEIISEEHMLFGYEAAGLALQYCGIATVDGKPATKMLEALMDDIAAELGFDAKLYYNTRNGLRRVYPAAKELISELQCGINRHLETELGIYIVEAGGRKYRYQVLSVEQ